MHQWVNKGIITVNVFILCLIYSDFHKLINPAKHNSYEQPWYKMRMYCLSVLPQCLAKCIISTTKPLSVWKKKKDIQTMFPFGLGSLLFILHNVLKWKALSCFLPWCDLCSAAFGPDSHSCDNSPCHVMPLHASALTVRTTGCSSVVGVRSHNAAYTQTQRIVGNSVSAELTDTFHGP